LGRFPVGVPETAETGIPETRAGVRETPSRALPRGID
jgi:hypothetical protein